MDGWNKIESLTTPGGDLGEFVLALHVFQNYYQNKTPLPFKTIKNALKKYLNQMTQSSFNWCTDQLSIDSLKDQTNEADVNIQSPPKRVEKKLLKHLIEPGNIGSIHLWLMVQNPYDYKIEKKLVQKVIKAFYQLLWSKKKKYNGKLQLNVLQGSPNESGFLTIRSGAICTKSNAGPLIAPNHNKMSFYLTNIDSVQTRRAQLTYFFVKVIGGLYQFEIETEKFFNDMNRWGTSFLEISATKIGAALPFYDVTMN